MLGAWAVLEARWHRGPGGTGRGPRRAGEPGRFRIYPLATLQVYFRTVGYAAQALGRRMRDREDQALCARMLAMIERFETARAATAELEAAEPRAGTEGRDAMSPSSQQPPPHPDIAPLAWLLGTWRGEGAGSYPTIPSFRYGEELRFWHVGKPFVAFAQRTWALDDGRPLHAEAGYWRPKPQGVLELALAEPTGLATIYQGRLAGRRAELTAATIARAPTAKEVTQVQRVYELRDGGVLGFTMAMAAVGQPLTHHLAAELRKTAEPGAAP